MAKTKVPANSSAPAPSPGDNPEVTVPTSRIKVNYALKFAPATRIDTGSMKALTLPPIVKPSELSVPGQQIVGTIVEFLPSPVTTYKTCLAKLRNDSGAEFCVPVTAVIGKALKMHKGIKSEDDASPETFKPAVGLKILIEGDGVTGTLDGQRSVNLFKVFVLTR